MKRRFSGIQLGSEARKPGSQVVQVVVKGVNVMEKDSTREDLEGRVQQTIGEICYRLDEAVKPTLIQILTEGKRKQKPAIATLLGIVAFAASEVALGVQIMVRSGADQNKLVEFCASNFKRWMLDCIEQNIAGPPN